MKKLARRIITMTFLTLALLVFLQPLKGIARDVDAKTVATIGKKKYKTLPAAVKAAKKGQTIKLVSNTTLGKSLSVNKKITINMNKKTITVKKNKPITVKKKGNLTLKNGKIQAPGQNYLDAKAGSKVTVKSGTYLGTLSADSSTVTIKGGTFMATGASMAAIDSYKEGGKSSVLTITGGKFSATQEDTIRAENTKVAIKGGTFDAVECCFHSDRGSGNISAGKFNGKVYIANPTSFNISGGTFNNDVSYEGDKSKLTAPSSLKINYI
jgi:hypothetical protein